MMTFKNFLIEKSNTHNIKSALEILFEGRFGEDTSKKMLEKAGKEDAYESLFNITNPYVNNQLQAIKANKQLPLITKWYLEDNASISQLKHFYDRYARMTKLHKEDISNMNFVQFTELIDRSVHLDLSKVDVKKGEFPGSIYSDENIVVYVGDTKEKCILYSQKTKYGLCIGIDGVKNMYHHYRAQGITTYFVYFKNRFPFVENLNFIIVDAYWDNTFGYNKIKPNHDKKISKEKLIEKIPEIKDLLGTVIKPMPFSAEEKYMYKVIAKSNFEDLKTLKDKLIYLDVNDEIYYSDWDYVTEEEFIPFVTKYIELNTNIPNHIYEKLSDPLKTRYETIFLRDLKEDIPGVIVSEDNRIIDLSNVKNDDKEDDYDNDNINDNINDNEEDEEDEEDVNVNLEDIVNILLLSYRFPNKIFILPKNCSDLFYRAMGHRCDKIYILNVSNWDTSKVTNMDSMFNGCSNLEKIIGINKWNTSNVTSMKLMFYSCENLKYIDLSNWDTSNVRYMDSMFSHCESLEKNNVNNWVNNWDTSKVTDMDSIFFGYITDNYYLDTMPNSNGENYEEDNEEINYDDI